MAKALKKPEEGWVMQDGTPWPGNNTRDHPGMIQVKTLLSRKIILRGCLSSNEKEAFFAAGLFGK